MSSDEYQDSFLSSTDTLRSPVESLSSAGTTTTVAASVSKPELQSKVAQQLVETSIEEMSDEVEEEIDLLESLEDSKVATGVSLDSGVGYNVQTVDEQKKIDSQSAVEVEADELSLREVEREVDWQSYTTSYITEVFEYIRAQGGINMNRDNDDEEYGEAGPIDIASYIAIEKLAQRAEHEQIVNKSIFDGICEALVLLYPAQFNRKSRKGSPFSGSSLKQFIAENSPNVPLEVMEQKGKATVLSCIVLTFSAVIEYMNKWSSLTSRTDPHE